MVVDPTGIEKDIRLCDQLAELRGAYDQAVIAPRRLRSRATSMLLVFEVESAAFAVRADHLAEVVRGEGMVTVPDSPAGIAGALTFRQEVISVLDLRRLLKFPDQGHSRSEWVLVLRSQRMQTALLADSIIGVWKIETGKLDEQGEDVDCVAIIARTLVVENRSVAILNVEALTSMVSDA